MTGWVVFSDEAVSADAVVAMARSVRQAAKAAERIPEQWHGSGRFTVIAV
jgi:hypothetical protein